MATTRPANWPRARTSTAPTKLPRGRHDLARYRVNMIAARAPRGARPGNHAAHHPHDAADPGPPQPAARLAGQLVFEQGLVLVTGPTGLGQDHFAGAIIRHLLEQPDSHRKILTYEAPIEFVYDFVPRSHALIAQHEIGVHLPSFAAGVRNSLRRKPMVILVGEARDAETIDALLLAAPDRPSGVHHGPHQQRAGNPDPTGRAVPRPGAGEPPDRTCSKPCAAS